VCALPVETLKWEADRLKAALARFASICLRKASKSGFASRGSCFGIAAVNDLTEDDGELQFSRGITHESRGSAAGSTASPK
jgi:hypothetical protein